MATSIRIHDRWQKPHHIFVERGVVREEGKRTPLGGIWQLQKGEKRWKGWVQGDIRALKGVSFPTRIDAAMTVALKYLNRR